MVLMYTDVSSETTNEMSINREMMKLCFMWQGNQIDNFKSWQRKDANIECLRKY